MRGPRRWHLQNCYPAQISVVSAPRNRPPQATGRTPLAPIQYIVEGGHRLSGSIEPSGNKNAALPIIAAALLTEHPVTLQNVPRIRDVETLVELVKSLGVDVKWTDRNTLHIHAKSLESAHLDPNLCRRIRASILLAAPMLVRTGFVELAPPGGGWTHECGGRDSDPD